MKHWSYSLLVDLILKQQNFRYLNNRNETRELTNINPNQVIIRNKDIIGSPQ